MLKPHFLSVGHGDCTVIERISVVGLLAKLAMSPTQAPVDWRTAIEPIVAGLALCRMPRFARPYARELFVQFLHLPVREMPKEAPQ